MSTAPIGDTGLGIPAVLQLPDCWRAGEERVLLHFLSLREQDRPAESLDLQKTLHTNDKFQAESPLLSWKGKLKVHQLGFSWAVYALVSLGYLGCLSRSLFGRESS